MRSTPTPNTPGRLGRLHVVYRDISELTPDSGNPRVHTPKQVRQIAASIKAFGFNVPLLVDREGKVIAGHGRLLACRELGWTEVPTLALEHLNEAQAKAFLLADNRLSELAEWDDRLLAEHLRALAEVELDFSLEATGFEMGEIDLRIESLKEEAATADPADQIPDLPTDPPVTRPGDLWTLGAHRVLCGNALVSEDLEALMEGRKASVVFTDPPFNVPIDGHVSGQGRVRHPEFAMACGEMSPAEFTTFLCQALGLLAAHSTDGSLHFVCMDWRHLTEVLEAGRSAYTEFKNLCVWAKDRPGMGSLYRSRHELVLVFKKGTAPHQNHIQLGVHGRNRSNLWPYPSPTSFGRSAEEGNLQALHPTVKPVALVADALMDCSRRGEVVLDSFLGSGTTLIAAERVGRLCCGLELEPRYVDVAIRRWQALTGKPAIHARTGRTFEACEAEARPRVEAGEASEEGGAS